MLDNVHLAYAPNGCPPTQKTSAFVVFHVPLTLCGTAIQVGVDLRLEGEPHFLRGITGPLHPLWHHGPR